jgi:hypothetical protein
MDYPLLIKSVRLEMVQTMESFQGKDDLRSMRALLKAVCKGTGAICWLYKRWQKPAMLKHSLLQVAGLATRYIAWDFRSRGITRDADSTGSRKK